jgi:hypothetical protein
LGKGISQHGSFFFIYFCPLGKRSEPGQPYQTAEQGEFFHTLKVGFSKDGETDYKVRKTFFWRKPEPFALVPISHFSRK